MSEPLEKLEAGMRVLVGADRSAVVSPELAARFARGDGLVYDPVGDQLLHLPARERELASAAVARACAAFAEMRAVDDAAIERFFAELAGRLERDDVWSAVEAVNRQDVERARERGRSTTRLVADAKLRNRMILGVRGWLDAPSQRGRVLERVEHEGWSVELLGAELGVVGFVFEGRPNVLADACGVLRAGNSCVLRIGSDALQTARALVREAIEPALGAAGLPRDAVVLLESPEHAAGWALFSDARLDLAVARGSGPAVAMLGALARAAGVPVSLHGTGGAWIVASQAADAEALESAVRRSLDRKVCNTLNVACVARERAAELVPRVVAGLRAAGDARGQSFRLHVIPPADEWVDPTLFRTLTRVRRAQGDREEAQASPLPEAALGREWEWEETPEITLVVARDLDHAVELANRHSPRFVASLISADPAEHERFYRAVEAPFVCDDHTRWVDGQLALHRPELGLSNWQNGRLLARGGVLSGDGVFTVRARVRTAR